MDAPRKPAPSSRLAFLVPFVVLVLAVLLTVVNVTAPTSHIPMLSVYTTNSTPEQDNVNADFGLYGYCTYVPVVIFGNDTELVEYCSSFQVGYNAVQILNYAQYDPHDLFSSAETAHLNSLTGPLVLHMVAAILAWGTLIATLLVKRFGTLPALAGSLATTVFVLVAICLDTALFVPMLKAIQPLAIGASLSSGYWMTLVAFFFSVIAAVSAARQHGSLFRYRRTRVTYVKVEEGRSGGPGGLGLGGTMAPSPGDIPLQERRDIAMEPRREK